MTVVVGETRRRRPDAFEALDYQAPFLIERLLKQRTVETPDAGHALFTEVKRYLILCHVDRTKTWQMYSHYVDEAWHQFILFTAEYTGFCQRYFGRYLHHRPSNAPGEQAGSRPPDATFVDFAERYRQCYAVELPDIWDDARQVTLQRRVLNDRCGQLTLGSADGMTDLIDANGRVLLNVSDIAFPAMKFIIDAPDFYVREVPGELTGEEKVGLVSAMVNVRVLRVG